jgi:hypothetical protein
MVLEYFPVNLEFPIDWLRAALETMQDTLLARETLPSQNELRRYLLSQAE